MPTATAENGNIKLIFARILANIDINYRGEASDDLHTWITIASSTLGSAIIANNVVMASEVGTNVKTVTILERIVIDNGGSRFVRLKVVRP